MNDFTSVDLVSELKSNVNRELEVYKKQGIIKSGLEIELSLQSGNFPLSSILNALDNQQLNTVLNAIDKVDLADSFICSQVNVNLNN